MTAPCTPCPVVRYGVSTAEGKLLTTRPTRQQANSFLWAGSERYVAEIDDDGGRE